MQHGFSPNFTKNWNMSSRGSPASWWVNKWETHMEHTDVVWLTDLLYLAAVLQCSSALSVVWWAPDEPGTVLSDALTPSPPPCSLAHLWSWWLGPRWSELHPLRIWTEKRITRVTAVFGRVGLDLLKLLFMFALTEALRVAASSSHPSGGTENQNTSSRTASHQGWNTNTPKNQSVLESILTTAEEKSLYISSGLTSSEAVCRRVRYTRTSAPGGGTASCFCSRGCEVHWSISLKHDINIQNTTFIREKNTFNSSSHLRAVPAQPLALPHTFPNAPRSWSTAEPETQHRNPTQSFISCRNHTDYH